MSSPPSFVGGAQVAVTRVGAVAGSSASCTLVGSDGAAPHEKFTVALDHEVALRDARNELLGIMTVEEAYAWDRASTAEQVLGTRDVRHPLVAEMQRWGEVALSGRLEILALPVRHDFRDLRLTPAETRARLAAIGAASVVAFQTRNPCTGRTRS